MSNDVKLKGRDLISIADLSSAEAQWLIKKAATGKKGKVPPVLNGRTLALLFEKPSLRTRVSFDVAMDQLGGHCLYLSPQEVALGKREPVADVARVLTRYVNGIVARTFAHETVVSLAKYASVPVINGLSDCEHPCQALADLLTIYEKKGKLEGITLAYVGDGNNVANSLMLAAAHTGMRFRIASPAGYAVCDDVLGKARELARRSGAEIVTTADPGAAVAGADVVYTDVWVSMGQESQARERLAAMAPYQVNKSLLERAHPDALFMHPLPAHHGEEVADGVIDSPQSVVFDQAENRLHIQRTILAEVMA
ncbi:MAG: ornithine carbamoyltransferase [Chloroflexi bacterium]|nr:ornithine carbamoyltransferase [Chloroflexota bacterium]